MRRLLLLRHAKAVSESGEGDFARALTSRGRSDAALMGRALDTKVYIPKLVLCSSARRTTETFEYLVAELMKKPLVELTKSLYLAPPAQILALLRKTIDEAAAVMMIGHNTGIEELAMRLARKPQSKDEARRFENLRGKYPTCALAVLDFDIESWNKAAPGSAALTDFIRPRDLRT